MIDGKVYIGKTIKTVEDRFSRHYFQPSKSYLHRALRKHGRENFDVSVIDSAETDMELCEKEKYWIKFYDCKFPDGYNMTDGGDGMSGCYPSESTIEKLRLAAKGNKKFLGKIHSDETKKKISIANTGNKSRRGKPHKDSTKALISKSHSGEKSSSAKLTWAQVIDIRRRYANERITMQRLADEYGITIGTVQPLIAGKTWREYAGN